MSYILNFLKAVLYVPNLNPRDCFLIDILYTFGITLRKRIIFFDQKEGTILLWD